MDDEDKPVILASMTAVQAQYEKTIVTEVMPLGKYFPAEDYHQHYLDKNPGGYCHINTSDLSLS
jgi:peptide methionine sulfoxide reductase MsrA